MWWSVPADVTEFNTWREKTTVYHEGVPGHHLQCGQAVYARATLNTWRRLACWVSGHGEGWALYAERLMADLGFLDDDGDRLGMLDAQRMRAARVVLDIGVHLGLPPRRRGAAARGRRQGARVPARQRQHARLVRAVRARPLPRLAGPGAVVQGRAAAVEATRDDARATAQSRGEQFDAKAFHERALNLGSVGLDVLRDALSS